MKYSLTDICDFQGGSQPPKEEWTFKETEGYIRMLQIRDFTQSERVTPEYIKISSSTKTCETDDILIARYGASLGKILTGLAGAYNVAIMKSIPDLSLVSKKYIYYYFKSPYFQNSILNVGVRAAQAGFNKEDLSKLQITCPEKDVQEEVCNKLAHVEKLIEARKEQLSQLDTLIKARFVEMFGTYPQNERGWDTGIIRDIVTEVRYGSSRPAVDGGAYPYLRMNNITYGGELDLTDVKQIDVPENELPKCTVRRGDVLFNRTNSKELVGKTCVYNRDEQMVLAGFVIRVRVNDRVLPEFLSTFLNTDFSKQMLLGMCKTAIGQANINAQEMQNIGLYLPPIELQKQFVDFKAATDKLGFNEQCRDVRQDAEGSLLTKGDMTDETDSATARMSSERSEVRMGTAGVAEKAGVAGEIVKISDICVINPRMPELDEQMNISFVPMQSVGEDGSIDPSEIRRVSEVKKGFASFQEEDVLFAKITPCMENGKGAVAMNLQNNIGFGSTEFHVLRPNQDRVLPQWLFYLTHWSSFRKLCERNMTGSAGQKRVPKAFLEKYEITLPILEIQNYQVSVLSKIDQLISVRKKELEQLDILIKARFVEMFGEPIANPMGWDVKPLKEMSVLITNGNTPKGGSENYVESGITFLRSQNVWRNRIELDDVAYIDDETHQKMKKSSLKHKDILITKTGRINTENSSLGRAALYLGEDDQANINGHVYLVRLDGTVVPEFVVTILTGEAYRKYIRKVCVGGIDKRQINVDQVEDFPIILPPHEMQKEFADFVIQVDKSKLMEVK